LQTLARTLVDPTADSSPDFNNSSLAVLGADLLGYYTAEYLICRYPRLPIEVLFAAQRAYVGPEALAAITREWGVEAVAAPGGEVDPGFLQFRQESQPGYQLGYHAQLREQERQALLPESLRTPTETENVKNTLRPTSMETHWRKSVSSRIFYDDQFGSAEKIEDAAATTTLHHASKSFVRALVGAIYLYLGRSAAKTFYKQHFTSRSLDFSKLFSFKFAARDLSRLCLREGFEPPVARLISETGRLSSHPVFVVGVYSGRDKLGEGVGGSLNEAKIRAATAALKGWYLYSPLEVTYPSEVDDGDKDGIWKPNMVDLGEIIT
jgi:dsRNA-specific ribonuclease